MQVHYNDHHHYYYLVIIIIVLAGFFLPMSNVRGPKCQIRCVNRVRHFLHGFAPDRIIFEFMSRV